MTETKERILRILEKFKELPDGEKNFIAGYLIGLQERKEKAA